MRTISSWKEMGIPTRASSLAIGRAIRKLAGLKSNRKAWRFR